VNVAIIVAGGEGERAGRDGGKQLVAVAGRPVLQHTLAAFVACPAVDEVVVVVHPDRVEEYRAAAIAPLASPKVSAVVGGGSTRQESVAAGLAAVAPAAEVILVHDGARPLVTPELIGDVIAALENDSAIDGIVVGHPSYDTLKLVDGGGSVTRTLDRAGVWAAQTPQAFRAGVLRHAYASAAASGYAGTDDASLVEHDGGSVKMFPGPRDNIKVTVPEDLRVVDWLLEIRNEGSAR